MKCGIHSALPDRRTITLKREMHDRIPDPGSWPVATPLITPGIIASAHGDVHGPDRLAVGGIGPGDAGRADPQSAPNRRRAPSASCTATSACTAPRGEELGIDADEARLHVAAVGDDPAAHDRRGAGAVDESGDDESAGQRFGGRHGHPRGGEPRDEVEGEIRDGSTRGSNGHGVGAPASPAVPREATRRRACRT